MRSRFWWASFSNRTKSCISTGPRGPAVMLFWLSETGMPLSVVSVGRLATDLLLCRETTEIPAARPLAAALLLLSQRALDRIAVARNRAWAETYAFAWQ